MSRSDARGKEHKYTIDTAVQNRHLAKHIIFINDEEIKAKYYLECMELLRVVVFDHTIRRRRPGTLDGPQMRQPVPHEHVDRTPTSSISRVHKHFPPSEASDLLLVVSKP
ncbi:hypothetical protein SCLCIDRAFT_1174894 [Scleroderma citrinum Foug A]|uniref:Uncharacterized protein n=1 Tax=Scleroderma citrinum Foug A TaxID=1036808 RepID=A0A0C3DQ72_9AGAM|nr:hypothetical protein SCLCIDRAFT_1174894 [Scleroderma citrinum Foug A]